MNSGSRNIIIEEVAGKPYCKVSDNEHVYFIPAALCSDVHDYIQRASFENHEVSSIHNWYLGLPMETRKSIIVVVEQKIA